MFKLTIAQVDSVLFEGEVVSATLPGRDGELTVLARHEPLLTPLRAGEIVVRRRGAAGERFVVERGILEVGHDEAVVLV